MHHSLINILLIFQLIPLANTNLFESFLSRAFSPICLRSHPLAKSRQFTMVTEFSQWLAAMATEDFTLINPMQEGMMNSAVSVLDAESSNLILQGTEKDICMA